MFTPWKKKLNDRGEEIFDSSRGGSFTSSKFTQIQIDLKI
jgi:hypothetical protein